MADAKIEMEIALRDSVSLTLKAIAANLEAVNEKLTRGGDEMKQGGDSIQKISKHTRDLGENVKATSRHLVGLGDSIIKIGAFLGPIIGPSAALVGGTTLLGNKLKEFTNERMRLKQLSENSGFTEDDVSIMQRTQKRMGISREEANANIERVGSKLQGLLVGRTGSELYRGLADMGLARFGKELLAMVETGDIGKAFRMILIEYETIRAKFGEAAASHYAGVVGLDDSFLQRYTKASQGVVPAFRMSIEAAEDWGERWDIIHHNLHNWWNWTVGNMIWSIVRTEEAVAAGAKTAGEMPIVIPGAEGAQPAPYATKPSKDVQAGDAARDVLTTQKDTNKLFGNIKDILQRMWEKDKGQNLTNRQQGGPVIAGRQYIVGEGGPELFGSAGRFTLVGEGGAELFRPKTTGTITKASVTADMRQAMAIGEEAARAYEPKGLGDPRSIVADALAGPMKRPLHVMKRYEDDPAMRTWLRSFGEYIPQSVKDFIGVKPVEDDPTEPAPWRPGGEWDRVRAGMDAAGANFDSRWGAMIEFKNVPQGVKTTADADGFDDFVMSRSQAAIGAGVY